MPQAPARDPTPDGNSAREGLRRDARGVLEPLGWMLLCMALGNIIRYVWLNSAFSIPSWGGLFVDMVGIAVAGLARGPAVACGVVVLNQIYRMTFGQISNAFVPVEIAGAVFWGWMATRKLVELDWRRPHRVLKTYALAAVGGGVVCGLAAWTVNLVLHGQWDFMPIQQHLYQHFDPWSLAEAIPVEMAISVWDKSVSVALALGVLMGLRAAGRRRPALAPNWTRTLRRYAATLAVGMGVLIVWGIFLCFRIMWELTTGPLAVNFLLLRQTLVVSAAYLVFCIIFSLILITRREVSLNRLTFTLGWASVSLGALVVFLSGVYLAANALSWGAYRATWANEHQVLEILKRGGSQKLHPGMGLLYLKDIKAPALGLYQFLPSWEAARRITWGGDLEPILEKIFPPRGAQNDEVEGYLESPEGIQIALFTKEGPLNGGPAILYQEAPSLFSRSYRSRLVPTLSVMFVLFFLMGVLMLLLGRQMLDTTGEAVLGRQARTLAQRIQARNRELESLQRTLEASVSQRESRIRELANLAEVGKAVGILAHEIRNPIGTIQLAFGNLLDTLGSNPRTELSEQVLIIERQLRHMNMLTQSVLAFSRGTPQDREGGRCSAAEVCRNCQALFNPTSARFGVTFTTEEPSPDFLVAARENEVIQILQNLILNAVEAIATSEPPVAQRTVTLAARLDGTHALFEVSDSGPGVSAGDREKIFDIFYSRKAQGTGLGLFVARELARMLQGDLTIGEGAAHGCRFVFRIPTFDEDPGRR